MLKGKGERGGDIDGLVSGGKSFFHWSKLESGKGKQAKNTLNYLHRGFF